LGFVCLFVLIISNTIMRPRLPPRKTGSLVEWAAFKEPQYTLFAIGGYLFMLSVLYLASYSWVLTIHIGMFLVRPTSRIGCRTNKIDLPWTLFGLLLRLGLCQNPTPHVPR
jgi:hypothetical protein